MDAQRKALAQECLEGAETDGMTFPQIVAALMQGGFEGYAVDFRRRLATYYLPAGDSVQLATHADDLAVSAAFDAQALTDAIREAQALAPGYSYKGFCRKAKAAGCAGYMVSFTGRRAVYFGRTAEIHVERFPSAA